MTKTDVNVLVSILKNDLINLIKNTLTVPGFLTIFLKLLVVRSIMSTVLSLAPFSSTLPSDPK